MKLTDAFTITITEKDVAAAGPYRSNGKCLLATALSRRHIKSPNVGGFTLLVPSGCYDIKVGKVGESPGPRALKYDGAKERVTPEAVGLKIRFIKTRDY